MDRLSLAKLAVEESNPANIPDFAYFGDLPVGETWAWTFSRTRDSDDLENSNFEVIWEDMNERFPEDCEIEGFNHWACGWLDKIAVRMLDDSGNLTAAGDAILDWKERLESYPVADEEDFSRREYEHALELIEWNAGLDCSLKDDLPDDWARQIFSEMFNIGLETCPECICSKDMAVAAKSLGFVEEEE